MCCYRCTNMNQFNNNEWGSWILSEKTLNFLRNEQVECTEGVNQKKYSWLIQKIKSKTNHEKTYVSQEEVCSLMCDYLPFDYFVKKEKDVSLVSTNEGKDVNDLVQQIVSNIKIKSENVQEIIELVSNTNSDVLINVLSDVWRQLTLDEEKKAFIKLISSCALSLQLFCKDILLAELKGSSDFHVVMEIILSEVQRLGSQLIFYTLLPLLKDSSSLLVKEALYLNKFMELFSNVQKSDLLNGYIDIIEGKLQRHHLEILEILLDNIPLKNSGFIKLVDLLSGSIMNYSDDRTLGKILLLIADNVTTEFSKNALNDFNNICNNFKGFMRFRIKASLKKKINF